MHWIAPSEKDTDNAALEKRLWDAADQFRANSGLKPQEYSTPVLGLIFPRFAEPRDAVLFGRETKGEVVLLSRLRAALERLDPALASAEKTVQHPCQL